MNERADVYDGPKPPKPSNYLLGFEVQGPHLVHNSNMPRPATNEEKILWAEYQRSREEYKKVCSDLWNMYQAGTGQNIHTFAGVTAKNPIEDVRKARNDLIHVIQRTKRQIEEHKVTLKIHELDADELLTLLDINNVDKEN